MDEEQPGRFERDFDEIEEVGSGEFGKVMKVKSKNGSDGVVSAVKRSKRFEGAKHRYVKSYYFFGRDVSLGDSCYFDTLKRVPYSRSFPCLLGPSRSIHLVAHL
jgi:hypothetical protein